MVNLRLENTTKIFKKKKKNSLLADIGLHDQYFMLKDFFFQFLGEIKQLLDIKTLA